MKKHLPKIITTLSVVIFMIALSIMVIGTIAIKRNEPLYLLGRAVTAIPTGSMEGNLEDSLAIGDLAIIKKGNYEDVKIGEIVVFQQPVSDDINILVIHRVIDIKEEGFVTKGDANPGPDQGFVTEEEFQGVYVSKITCLRPIVTVITTSLGKTIIFGLITILLLGLLFSEIIHIIKTVSSSQKEEIQNKAQLEIEQLKEIERQKIIEEEIKKRNE
ncbi:MAG: signal peptidase I [Acholeplasmataceae bacterium]|nr:signal peptidase I [Acholeplasmataceae bacterium]